MKFKCRWYESSPLPEERCQADAETMIIYGCTAEHINEIWFCTPHATQWMFAHGHKPKKCGWCHCKILEYVTLHTIAVKDDYQMPMKSRYRPI